MSLHFMPGVSVKGIKPEAVLGLVVASECFQEVGEDALVTSVVRTGTWAQVLLHGAGMAFDLSTRRINGEPIPRPALEKAIGAMRARIDKASGGQFDVLAELDPGSSPGWTGPHLHLEFDPR